MDRIELHDGFVAQGCSDPPQPAVSVGAGAVWLRAYEAVSKAGRYVQGGGCTTVGVAGLIQSGGFGSFSKRYGLAAAGLIEAEVVTADGQVRIANGCTNPDLFWALKGGGGGSFGVVTRLTLRTHELPDFFGGVFGAVHAKSDAAYRALIQRFLAFYRERLLNPHWGEQAQFRRRQRACPRHGVPGPRPRRCRGGVAAIHRLGGRAAGRLRLGPAARDRRAAGAPLLGRRLDEGECRRISC